MNTVRHCSSEIASHGKLVSRPTHYAIGFPAAMGLVQDGAFVWMGACPHIPPNPNTLEARQNKPPQQNQNPSAFRPTKVVAVDWLSIIPLPLPSHDVAKPSGHERRYLEEKSS